MVCLPLFPDHVVRIKTADLKSFPFCLGHPPFLAPSRANSLSLRLLAVSSPCLVLSVYWPTLLVESNGQRAVGLLIMY